MVILHKHLIICLFITLLLSGCSIMLRPSAKPFLATESLHQVDMEGATVFAPDEYQVLLQEYWQIDRLYRSHQYTAVNARYPRFADHAEKLIQLVHQRIINAEEDTAKLISTQPSEKTTSEPIAIIELQKTATIESVTKPRTSYLVVEGDLLWSIAKRPDVYGDPFLWPLLYQANRDQIKDPRTVYAGQTLSIPRNISETEREDARSLAKKSDFFSHE